MHTDAQISHNPSSSARAQASTPARFSAERSTGAALALPATVWLIACVALPLAMMLVYSLFGSVRNELGGFTLEHIGGVIGSTVFQQLFLRTLLITVAVTAISLVLALPIAYHLSLRSRRAPLLLTLLLLPYLIGIIPRLLALRLILGAEGLLGSLVSAVGLSSEIVRPLLFTKAGTIIGLTYVQLPVMIILAYLAIERLDRRLLDAAADLGASSAYAFATVVVPNARAGLAAGAVLVGATTYGAYVEPALLGGASGQLAGNVIAQRFVVFFDWGRGSALAIASLFVIAVFGLAIVGIARLLGRSRVDSAR
ncbi:MAG: ABC transporter permease [Thermomicrobiales bacterium]|nr:ABC transporter permease [Thermomicrobiales bacterium]